MISNGAKAPILVEGKVPFVPFSGPFEVFDYIVSNYKESDLTVASDRAYVYFYLYRFKQVGTSIIRLVENRYDFTKKYLKENQSVDLAVEYGTCAYILSSYHNKPNYLDEARKFFGRMDYYFLMGRSGLILPKSLGFVLGLLTVSNADEIYERVTGAIRHETVEEDAFLLNYYMALKIKNVKFDSQDVMGRASRLLSRNMVSPIEKVPALLFVDKPENYFREVVGAFENPSFYYNLFNIHLDYQSSDFSSFQPTSVVNFLIVSKMLGWDKLALVPPSLLDNAEKMKDKRDPVVLEKEYVRKKTSHIVLSAGLIGLSIGAAITAAILAHGIVYRWISVATSVGLTVLLWVIDKHYFDLLSDIREKE